MSQDIAAAATHTRTTANAVLDVSLLVVPLLWFIIARTPHYSVPIRERERVWSQ